MAHHFKFFKGHRNTEAIQITVDDPAGLVSSFLNEDGKLSPSSLSKIALIINNDTEVVISSESGEITWIKDVILIKPTVAHLNELPSRSHGVIAIYKEDDSEVIAPAIITVR